MAKLSVHSKQTQLKQITSTTEQYQGLPTMVDELRHLQWSTFPVTESIHDNHNRPFTYRMGCLYAEPHYPSVMVSTRNSYAYQSTQARGGTQVLRTFFTTNSEQNSPGNDRQYSLYVLHKPARPCPISLAMHGGHKTLEFVHKPQYKYLCVIPPRSYEYYGGHTEQVVQPGTQMGNEGQSYRR